jgi:hypothetical protein
MMQRIEKVFVTVTIDTECDHDSRWVRSSPLSFHSVIEGIPTRLQPLFRAVGAVPAYLLTVEVMEQEACVAALRQLQGEHELGTHLHAAFVEPHKKFKDYAGIDSPDFQCHCAAPVERAKLDNLTRLFQRCFGYRPKTFRAGRFGAGSHTIDALESLGYAVDTSVTPNILWEHYDGCVDYRDAPEQPYIPVRGTLIESTGKGERRPILEIPVTTYKPILRGARWFRPWVSSIEEMKQVARHHLKRYAGEELVTLNMMFHSMEVIPKASPYPQTEGQVSRYLESLHTILSWCRGEGFVFASPRDIADAYLSKRARTETVLRVEARGSVTS